VDVRPKEQSIVDPMKAFLTYRLDMGCIEGRKRLLAGHRAAPLIYISYKNPECSLAQTLAYQDWIPVGGSTRLTHPLPLPPMKTEQHGIPKLFPRGGPKVIGLTLYYILVKIFRWGNPVVFVKEKWVQEDNTADHGNASLTGNSPAALRDELVHFFKRRGPIFLLKCLPGEGSGK